MSRPRVRHVLEYAAVRVLVWPLTWLPYRAALPLGWVLAGITYFLMLGRRRDAHRRIEQVFGAAQGPRWVRRIAWLSWRNMVFSAIEMARLPRLRIEWARGVMEYAAAISTYIDHRNTGRGAVLAIPHMGSWELAAAVCRLHGVPVFSIAANQKNALLNDYANRLRRSSGMPIVLRGGEALRQVVTRLRAGEMLAILPDLRQRTPGLAVPFLGGVANMADGMGRFARAADVPIFPSYIVRVGWFRHRIYVLPPIYPDPTLDKAQDALRMVKKTMAVLDETIRRHPDQWFWYNRRWVLDPLERKS